MPRLPLVFPTGDPALTERFDDRDSGGYGDLLAGDHGCPVDTIATRKGNYDTGNTWYLHYPLLPHPLGIRMIAKESSGNCGITDTRLMISDGIACAGDLDVDQDVDASNLFAWLPNLVVQTLSNRWSASLSP
jgi:hypothetical protein